MMSDELSPSASAVPWYVVYSKPHREGVAELHLRRKGFDVFYPKLELPPYAAAPRRSVPLFPGYLFARFDLARHSHEIAWIPGVKRLVGIGGVPTPLDPDVVAFLRQNASADGCLRARPDLQIGQEVQITDGPFAGLMAIVENPPDAHGRIRVLMRLLNRRPVAVRISMRFVKSAWVA
jgi:transcription elongation factor/antiterminator RfaH